MFDSSNNRGGDRADFLIVGGGAAGSVLGERLSEDSSVRVLLLEAGPDYAATRDVPQDLLDADQFPSSHDWGYQSEPGVLGRSIPVVRAKVIGGSSAHNGAVAGRGTPEDYDEWSRLGNPGWSFEQLLDDFRRLEDDPEGDVGYHGRGAPVPIRRYTDRLTLLHRSFIRTATESGFRRVEGVNGPDDIGVGVVARNVVDGVRQNGSIAYLERVRFEASKSVCPRSAERSRRRRFPMLAFDCAPRSGKACPPVPCKMQRKWSRDPRLDR